MSLERFKDIDGHRYWEVAIKCTANTNEKVIKRTVGRGNPWCSVDNSEACDTNKFTLSRALCGSAEQSEQQLAQQAITSQEKANQTESTVNSTTHNLTAISGGADSNKYEPDASRSPSKVKSSSISSTSNQPTTPATGSLVANNVASQSTGSKPQMLSAASRKIELMREQVQIEEQRIQIEQRRLQLVQTELELKKQKFN